MMRRRVKRSKQLLDELKGKRGYWELKEKAIDHNLWRTGVGRNCVPVVRQTIKLHRHFIAVRFAPHIRIIRHSLLIHAGLTVLSLLHTTQQGNTANCVMITEGNVQGGSNMTGTDLCVNKPHCAAAVRP